MKTAILIPGMPTKEEYFNPANAAPSNAHWFAWLQIQLLVKGILTQAIEMPEPYEPVYEKWCSVFEQFKIDEKTILVGHSCGAGFLVRWLSETQKKVGKVALVAPWLDPEKMLKNGMFDFEIDGNLASKTESIHLFYSTDDDEQEIVTANLLKEKVPGLLVSEFTDKGHFCLSDLKTEEFPGLRDWLLQ